VRQASSIASTPATRPRADSFTRRRKSSSIDGACERSSASLGSASIQAVPSTKSAIAFAPAGGSIATRAGGGRVARKKSAYDSVVDVTPLRVISSLTSDQTLC